MMMIADFTGVAASALVKDVNYKCDPAGKKFCYGLGATVSKFVAFQKYLDTFSRVQDGSLGFRTLKVGENYDGNIGSNVAAATVAILRDFGLTDAASQEVLSRQDYYTVAKWVPVLMQNMTLAAPTSGQGASTSATTVKTSDSAGTTPVYAKSWFWSVVGGIVLLGVGGTYWFTRRNKPQS